MYKYLKKYWLLGLLAIISMIGEASMDLIQPKMMKTIVDDGVLGLNNNHVGNMDIIISTGTVMIAVVMIGGVFGVLCGVFANNFAQRWGNDIRKGCFKRIMELSFQQTDKFSTGSLVTRVTNDVTQVQNLANQMVRGFVRTLMLFIGGIYCVATLDIKFGVVLAIALPMVMVAVLFFIKRATPFFNRLQLKLDKVNSVVQENVAGARVVKAYVKESYEKQRFDSANDELVETQLKVLKLFAYMSPLANIVLNLVMVLIIKLGAIEVQGGVATPGDIMAAITYLSRIMHSVMMMAMIFQTLSRGKASAGRINEVMETGPTITDGSFKGDTKVKGKVEFRNMSFAYPQGSGETVLKNINITINSGETFALLGATGCGKSTLVSLIPRFYDCLSGQVLVDDVDVKDYELNALRKKVAVALQKSELFNTSVRENVLWGNPSATEEELKRAIDIAQGDFVYGMADGLDSAVAEGGMSLSGGQKQRLSIARALLKNAEILIFDDSTSALDLKTEARLYKALNEAFPDTTKIIIAQRIASVKNADRIAVIDKGSIVACGTHNELMKTSKIYKDIYLSQQKEGGEENG